jgi:hypothetical protein
VGERTDCALTQRSNRCEQRDVGSLRA